ncbi:MAG: hypothetical protein RLP44_07280 [Aggregatilineales bacterium]
MRRLLCFFHSLRTYYWGSILAKQDGLQLDPELFYVMSVWHDIGLCDAHNHKDGISRCFAVEGGRSAGAFVREYGTEAQAQQVEEAIISHLNLYIPISHGIEKSILPAATALDVIGARIGEIQPDTILAVLERYPRLSFKSDLIALFNHEYATRPHSRIAFMQRVANLNRLIEQAPFAS